MMTEVMARHPDVQDKLRAEIIEAQERYGMDLPYDELVALPYMDAFCREILRLCVQNTPCHRLNSLNLTIL